ncbi:transcription factor Hsr1 [Phytophthora boehmeriae]|uniref:Transcription factor Hsr1 n=1 Tax=Phytophthora boehmeriae TaxID=109152 RepID=A0A8T1W2N1_9STRA|nr:transcription factor Hsr1 [Phytophthora boehmeriae]
MTVHVPALPAIATGFIRKLYRILDLESATIIAWDVDGASFVIRDGDALETSVLPRYFRGRLSAFRQQLREHEFALELMEQGQERYRHQFFRRGCPGELSQITHSPLPRKRGPRKKKRKQITTTTAGDAQQAVKGGPNRGTHRVTPYPLQHESESQVKHAVIEDRAALAANPLFADDESLSGFVHGLAVDGFAIDCVESTAPLVGELMSGKEELMPDDTMDALLKLLTNSLSTDGREGATTTNDALVTASTTTATTISVSTAIATPAATNSTSSTGRDFFSDGRPPVVLPALPPGIVEHGQFSDDTLNGLMRWATS